MKFSTKITLIILELALVPLFLMGFISFSLEQSENIQNTFTELDALAQLQKNQLQDLLKSKELLLRSFVGDSRLRLGVLNFVEHPNSESKKNLHTLLAEMASGNASIHNMEVIDTAGIVIGSTDTTLIGTNFSNEDFFIKGIRKNDVSFLRKNIFGTSSSWYLIGPVISSGKVIGVLSIVTDTNDITKIVGNYTGLGRTEETLLVKDDGGGNVLFLAPTRFDSHAALNRIVPKDDTNVSTLSFLQDKEGASSAMIDYRHVPVFSSIRYLSSPGWGIVVKIDQSEALAPIQKQKELLLFIILTTVIFLIIFGIAISRSITNPIRNLTAVVKKVANGDLSQNVLVSSRDEIGDLSACFNMMLESLKESKRDIDEKVQTQTADIFAKKQLLENQKKELEEEAARASDLARDLAKFKLAVDNVADQIIITDPDGIVLYSNKATAEVTGYTREETKGKKSGELWHIPMPKEFYEEMWRVIKTEKRTFHSQLKNRRKDGSIYEADISISPVLGEDGNVLFFVGIERDITVEKQVDQTKSEFVTLASHQLRTPLSSLNWYLEMLINGDAGAVTEKQMKFLKEAYTSGQRMSNLIGTLLDISRMELGIRSGEFEPARVNDLLHRSGEEFTEKIKEKELQFMEHYDPKIADIDVDAKTVRIIFQNLLSNSVKYTPKGGTINVKTALSSDKKHISIEVSDTGYGIPENQQKQIYTKFFRADNVLDRDTDGTGLGLYLAKMLVEQNGGTISFVSGIGKGTTFLVILPTVRVSAEKNKK